MQHVRHVSRVDELEASVSRSAEPPVPLADQPVTPRGPGGMVHSQSHSNTSGRLSEQLHADRELVKNQREVLLKPLLPVKWKAVLLAILALQVAGALFLFLSAQASEADDLESRNESRLERTFRTHVQTLEAVLGRFGSELLQWKQMMPFVTSSQQFDDLFNLPLVDTTVAYTAIITHDERADYERDMSADLRSFFNTTNVPTNITDLVRNNDSVVVGQVVSPVRDKYHVLTYVAPPLPPVLYMRDQLSDPFRRRAELAFMPGEPPLMHPRDVSLIGDSVTVFTAYGLSVVSLTNSSKAIGTLGSIMLWQQFVPEQLSNQPLGPVFLRIYDVTADLPDESGCFRPQLFGGLQDEDGSWTLVPNQEILDCPAASDPSELVPEDALFETFERGSREFMVVMTKAPGFNEEQSSTQFFLDSAFLLVSVVMVLIVVFNGWVLLRHMGQAAKATDEFVEGLAQAEHSAREAKEHRDQFLAFLSHELRNPLFGLQGTADETMELAGRCRDGDVRDELREAAVTLHGCTQQIERTLNTVVNVQNMTNGKIVLQQEPFSLMFLVKELHAHFEPEALDKDIQLDIHVENDVPDAVSGDRERLFELVGHLLRNAIEHSRMGSTVSCHVRLGTTTEVFGRSSTSLRNRPSAKVLPAPYEYDVEFKTPPQDSMRLSTSISIVQEGSFNVLFIVRDSGPGMDPRQIKRAFQPYTRERIARASQGHGSSLGLPIVQLLCRQMRGFVRVQSRIGHGCEFTAVVQLKGAGTGVGAEMVLPSLPSSVRESESVHDEHSLESVDLASFAGRFLAVDDQKINRRLVSRLLSKIMPLARVDVAEDGVQAVEFVTMAAEDGDPYSCVFMDIQMPRMSGTEATRQLRARDFDVPIIAVTGGSLEEEVAKYRASGMDAVIHKPCKKADFEAKLSEFWAAITSRAVSRSQRSSSRAGARAGASSPIHLLPGSA